MKRIATVWLVLAIGTCVARGEPAPRVQQVPEDMRLVRDHDGKVIAKSIYAPTPVYPYKARFHRWEGRGLFVLRLRPNGTVSGVAVFRSTGYKELDVAATQALIHWRFPPAKSDREYGIPVTFKMRHW
jgi:TonB family protein